jgi:1,4-dihydroxy-2-naphthoate octaprenyltransferase
MAETGRWEWGAVAAGVPLACWTAWMMYVNNWRDAEEDVRAGVRTLPGQLVGRGGRAAWWWAAALGGASWVAAALAAGGGAAPGASAWLALAVAPFWAAWMAGAWRRGGPGKGPVERAAAMHGAFSALYLCGWAWA